MPITVQPDLGLLQRPLITPKTAEQQAAEQALIDQRESLAQERKSKLADMRQAAMDTAAARAAWQASIDPKTGQVDYDQLIPNMVKNNASSAAIEKAQTGLDTHFDKQLAQQHLRDEHASAFQDLQSKFISGIDGQDKLDVANQLHPEWGLPKDFKTGEAQIKLMADAATTASAKAKDRIDALKEQRDALKFKTEDLPTAYAKGLQSAAQFVLADDPTNYANAKNGGLKEFGWSKDIIDRLPDPADPQRQQKLEAMARTSEQNATLAAQESARAETAKHNRALEGTEGLNARTNAGGLALRQKEYADKQAADAATAAGGPPPDAIAEYVKNVQSGKWQISNVPTKERDAVAKYLHQSGQDVAHMTAADWGMKNQAVQMLPMIDKTQELAKKIDQMGLTGTIGGRWRQIVQGESLGSALAGLTPAQKETVGEFASQTGMLITGIAKAHGGARAGGSPQMVAELKKYLDAANKDYDTFRGNLNGARNFMNTYAHMGEGQAPSGGGGAAAVPANVQSALSAAKPGRYTLSDGSVWVKGADGKVVKGGG